MVSVVRRFLKVALIVACVFLAPLSAAIQPMPASVPVINYQNEVGFVSGTGSLLPVSPSVTIFIPPQVCKPENCPPPYGQCTNRTHCSYRNGFTGLKTHPFGYATHYCKLSDGGCSGVTQVNLAHVTAGRIARENGLKLCEGASPTEMCMGIVALTPLMMGNSQLATDPQTGLYMRGWGLGLTEPTGMCYELAGPGGRALVAITDRCAGYCTCT